MHILFDLRTYKRLPISAEVYIADMMDAFVPALQEDDRVTILLGAATLLPWEPIEHPAVSYLIAQEIPGSLRANAEIVSIIKQMNPDIWWTADITLAPPKMKAHAPKIVYAVEDFRVLEGFSNDGFWKRYLTKRKICQNLLKAEAIICPLKAIATRLISVIGLAARHKTFIIENGIHPIFRPHSPDEVLQIRRKHLIPQRYVLTTCTSATAEYLTPVFEAIGASEEISSITCVVLGDAALPYTLRQVIRDCHLEGMIRFLNMAKLEPYEVAALYGGASILFEPSQDIAYLPSVLRALASGVPVICAASAANENIYGNAVLRVHPTDAREWIRALTALTLSSTLRDRQVANGHAQVSALTSTAMAKHSFAFARLLSAVPAATIRKNSLDAHHD